MDASMMLVAAAGTAIATTATTSLGWYRAQLANRRTQAANRELAERLAVSEYTAAHDPLTGLLNRGGFYAAAGAAVVEPGVSAAVVLFDLDGFKLVNDTFGHGIGDLVLVAGASHLREVLGDDAIVGRLGGDEFAAVVPVPLAGVDVDQAADVAARLDDAVGVDVDLPSGQITQKMSAGVAMVDGLTDLGTLLRRADAAAYRAKSLPQLRPWGTVAVHDPVRDDDTTLFPGERPAVRTRDLDRHVQLQLLGVVA